MSARSVDTESIYIGVGPVSNTVYTALKDVARDLDGLVDGRHGGDTGSTHPYTDAPPT